MSKTRKDDHFNQAFLRVYIWGGGGGGGGTRLADLNTCTVVLFMFVHFFNAGNHSIDQGEKYCCF